MTVYKLVDQNYRTRAGEKNETHWQIGVRAQATGALGQPLCTDGHIHGYEHSLVAVFMNPVHANIKDPRMLVCEVEEPILREGQLKLGARTMTPVKEIPCPKLSTEQRVEIAIRFALTIWSEPSFTAWAQQWIDGSDRSKEAAARAAAEAWAAEAAADAAEAAAREALPHLNLIAIMEQVKLGARENQ